MILRLNSLTLSLRWSYHFYKRKQFQINEELRIPESYLLKIKQEDIYHNYLIENAQSYSRFNPHAFPKQNMIDLYLKTKNPYEFTPQQVICFCESPKEIQYQYQLNKEKWILQKKYDITLKFYLAQTFNMFKNENISKKLKSYLNQDLGKVSDIQLQYILKCIRIYQCPNLLNLEKIEKRLNQIKSISLIDLIYILANMDINNPSFFKNLQQIILNNKQQTLNIQHIYKIYYLQRLYKLTFSQDLLKIVENRLLQLLPSFTFQEGTYVNMILNMVDTNKRQSYINKIQLNNYRPKQYLEYLHILSRLKEDDSKLIEEANHEIPYKLFEYFTAKEFQDIIKMRLTLGYDNDSKFYKNLHAYFTRNMNCFKSFVNYFSRKPDNESVPFWIQIQRVLSTKIKTKPKIQTFNVNILDYIELLSNFSRRDKGSMNFWDTARIILIDYLSNKQKLNQLPQEKKNKLVIYLFQIISKRFQSSQIYTEALALALQTLRQKWYYDELLELTRVIGHAKIGEDILWIELQKQFLKVNFEGQRQKKVHFLKIFNRMKKGSNTFWETYKKSLTSDEIQILQQQAKNSLNYTLYNYLRHQ